MATKLNPYLHFRDDARQAMEFYKTVFGGELTLSTFKEYGMGKGDAEDNRIMHAMLIAGDLTLMGADTPSEMEYNPGSRIGVSLSGEDEAELRGYYDKLVDGGTVTVPMDKSPWGDIFGMCTDKFGVDWLVNVNHDHSADA